MKEIDVNTIGGKVWLTDGAWSVIFDTLAQKQYAGSMENYSHQFVMQGRKQYCLKRSIDDHGTAYTLSYEPVKAVDEHAPFIDFLPEKLTVKLREPLRLVSSTMARNLTENNELFAGWLEIDRDSSPTYVWSTADDLRLDDSSKSTGDLFDDDDDFSEDYRFGEHSLFPYSDL